MNKQTLTKLISENFFQIPDYQRGYAWEKKQWDEFIQDLDALADDEVRSHYTGTVVVYADARRELKPYGKTKKLAVVDVVDGQQCLCRLNFDQAYRLNSDQGRRPPREGATVDNCSVFR